MYQQIKEMADKALALQNKDVMDETLREISACCDAFLDAASPMSESSILAEDEDAIQDVLADASNSDAQLSIEPTVAVYGATIEVRDAAHLAELNEAAASCGGTLSLVATAIHEGDDHE